MKIIFTFLLVVLFSRVNAQRVYPYGGINDDKLLKTAKTATTPSGKASFPVAYSLRKYAPIAGDQYPYGECVPWALCYTALTILESERLQRVDSAATTEAAFSPSFIYEQVKNKTDTNCSEGSAMVSALEIMKNIGNVRLHDLNYTCQASIDTKSIIQAASFKIKDYELLRDSAGQLIQGIKAAISSGNPVPFYMVVTPSFDQVFGQEYWKITDADVNIKNDFVKNANPNHLRVGWHGMCITGYDDTDQGGVLEILNSWGLSFGNKGYFKIKYNDFRRLYGACFVMHLDDWRTPESFVFKANVKILQTKSQGTSASLELTPGWFGPSDISGLKVQDFKNEILKVETTFKELDEFRLSLKGNLPTYIYVVNYDSVSHEIDNLSPNEAISPFINEKDFSVIIPSNGVPIVINGPSSDEYLTILFSQKQLSENDLLGKLKMQGHSYFENLQNALNDHMIDFKTAKFDKSDGTFTVNMNEEKYILPIVVTIKH